jgi:hypothetical protein
MKAAHASTAPQHHTVPREGLLDNRDLLVGTEGDPRNYRLAISRADTDWLTPRHRHNFEQIRFPIEGEFQYTEDKVLPAGHVGYFPEGVYYGPQTRKQGLYMLVLQFGGSSGQGFMGDKTHTKGYDAIEKTGKCEKGIYVYTDKDGVTRRKDVYQAIWEYAMEKPLVYPPPRYDDIITMNPAHYEWVPQREARGVACKWLGTFTEKGARVGFVKLDKGASFTAGTCPAPELIFVSKGAVKCQDNPYPLHTAFSFEAHEGAIPIEAIEPSECLVVQLETVII